MQLPQTSCCRLQSSLLPAEDCCSRAKFVLTFASKASAFEVDLIFEDTPSLRFVLDAGVYHPNINFCNYRPCKACRSAAMKTLPETVRGSRHGNAVKFLVKSCCLSGSKARKCPELFTTICKKFTPFFTRCFAVANAHFHGVFHSADVCL